MKRALAALLGVLVLLGASLYLFVVRPLLRPADMTAAAESALATEDVLLLGGINVKQAVFLERWFLGTPPVSTAQAATTPAAADRTLFDHLRAAGVDARHDVDHALYAVYPAAAESTRHAVVLLGRFNPPAINAYLTRELQATPRAGAGPASYEVVRTDPTTCRPGATWVVTVAPGWIVLADPASHPALLSRLASPPPEKREPLDWWRSLARADVAGVGIASLDRLEIRGLPAVREALGEGPGHRRRRLRARVRGARGEAGAAAGRAPPRDRREGRRPGRGAAQGLGAGGERLPRALAGQHAQRGRPPRQPEGSRRRLPEHHRVHRRPHPRRQLPARGQRAPGRRAGRVRGARRRARRGAAGRADRHRALAVRALARAAVAARLRSAGELRRGGGPDPGALRAPARRGAPERRPRGRPGAGRRGIREGDPESRRRRRPRAPRRRQREVHRRAGAAATRSVRARAQYPAGAVQDLGVASAQGGEDGAPDRGRRSARAAERLGPGPAPPADADGGRRAWTTRSPARPSRSSARSSPSPGWKGAPCRTRSPAPAIACSSSGR